MGTSRYNTARVKASSEPVDRVLNAPIRLPSLSKQGLPGRRSRIGARYPIATIKLLTSIKAVTGIQRIRSHRLFDIAFIRMPSTL